MTTPRGGLRATIAARRRINPVAAFRARAGNTGARISSSPDRIRPQCNRTGRSRRGVRRAPSGSSRRPRRSRIRPWRYVPQGWRPRLEATSLPCGRMTTVQDRAWPRPQRRPSATVAVPYFRGAAAGAARCSPPHCLCCSPALHFAATARTRAGSPQGDGRQVSPFILSHGRPSSRSRTALHLLRWRPGAHYRQAPW